MSPKEPTPPVGTQSHAVSNSGPCLAQSDSSFAAKWLLLLLPFAYLWFRLINNLSVEWGTNPQYSYGYFVPFLCLGLFMRRWQSAPVSTTLDTPRITTGGITALMVWLLAFLYLPTRLIEGSTPEWRPIQWLLGFEAVGLTLCLIYMGKGRKWLAELAFPVCLFFVAIPWPTLIEQPIIQGLTRASGAIVVEVLGILGVPSIQNGNVIEINAGPVGIDEACSGIRSFQTSFMISLFFGEFYRLNRVRRFLLVPIALMLAMAFNIGRMTLLTLIASKKGLPAIAEYHDPAGVTITVACTLAMWGVALLLRCPDSKVVNGSPDKQKQPLPGGNSPTDIRPGKPALPALSRVAFGLIIWLVIVEAGVQSWYFYLESGFKPGPNWSVAFPKENPTLKEVVIDATTRNLLRFDEGKEETWENPDGTHWQSFYCMWLPGRVAGYLAKRHTPEICLPATGQTLRFGPELMVVNVHGVELPVRRYVFGEPGHSLQVFHCRWEAGSNSQNYAVHDSARFNLVRGIWAGRGKHGQRVLEVIITGIEDPELAKQAFLSQLENLIQVERQPREVKRAAN
jgi:exosortase